MQTPKLWACISLATIIYGVLMAPLRCVIFPCHDEFALWHKHIGHMYMIAIQKILSDNVILGLPFLSFKRDIVYHDYQACKIMCLINKCLILLPIVSLRWSTWTLCNPCKQKVLKERICFSMCRWFLFVHSGQISSWQIKDLCKSETFANQRPLEHFKNYVFNFRMRTLLIYVDVLIFIISSQTP